MGTSISALQQILGNPNGAQMITASPSSALQNEFMQTPGYQLAYGNNTNLNPGQRFLNDQGTQLAIQAGLPSILNQYASKGLDTSGALANALAQNMYSNYSNFIGTQSGMFNNYQNQLSNLSQFGSTQTGGAQALSNDQALGSLLSGNYQGTASGLSNANLSTAAGQSQANLSTGQNIAQLLSNLGYYLGNANMNTAAAQGSNLFNGMGLLAQINGNQMASQASQHSSALGGQGALAGSQSSGMFSGGAF